jgi:hypothetical protein
MNRHIPLAMESSWSRLSLVGYGAARAFEERSQQRVRVVAATGGDPDRAPVIMRRYGCSGCHVVPGVAGARGMVGPSLDGFSKRLYVAGVLVNNLTTSLLSSSPLALKRCGRPCR